MNECDYNHLIKGRERAIVTHRIIILCVLFYILPQRPLNAPFKIVSWCLFFLFVKHQCFQLTLSGFKIKLSQTQVRRVGL